MMVTLPKKIGLRNCSNPGARSRTQTHLSQYLTMWDTGAMNLLFVEMVGFTEDLADYFPTDEHYHKFQTFLMKNHQAGDVLQGTGGLRKVRWPDARRGKGKRGGLRILYLHILEVCKIYILDVYDKDEADDLSTDQRKKLSQLVELIRTEELRRKGS